jgi:hypothetical protein
MAKAKQERPKLERVQVETRKVERVQYDDLPMPTDDDEENPLLGMDIETEAKADISEALRLFKERAAAANQRFVDNTDSEHWVAICFQNRAQKEEWLRETGLIDLGDKYLDGVAVARLMKRPLKTPTPPIPKFGHDKKLEQYAQPLDKPYPKRTR